MVYKAPEGDSAAIAFLVAKEHPYTPPDGNKVALEFAPREGPVGDTQYLFPAGADAVRLGGTVVRNQQETVRVAGFRQDGSGTPNIYLGTRYVALFGFSASGYGRPTVFNWFKDVYPSGFIATAYGQPYVFNRLQFLRAAGTAMHKFGTPGLIGGVKYLWQSGWSSASIGQVLVVNTTANQWVWPPGISAPAMGVLSVSPQMAYPFGISAWKIGVARVQRPPQPAGFDCATYGIPCIEYKTKLVLPLGIAQIDLAYPVVFDPTRRVWPQPVLQAGVFGDTSLRNNRVLVRALGSESLEMSAWAELRNTRRFLIVTGVDAARWGDTRVRNKTPSLAPSGFDALRMGSVANTDVSYEHRVIFAGGFSRGGVGLPRITKPPQLSPHGFNGEIGTATVWPRLRKFDIGGFVTLRMGAHEVDFRWRKVGLQDAVVAGAAYGQARVEHAVRVVSPVSFRREAFGTGWWSYRRRTLELEGIEPLEMSRHQIGGERYILPFGFVATRWGTRIVPEAQEIFPKTFGATYGWPTVEHYRRFVQPVGFATDTDYRDRWGLAKAWNLRQYIIQEENAESLLWPPAFSPWLKLENRNKTLGAIGYVATQYGRAQVDNKARLLAPSGIAAPVLPEYQKTGSVTHRVRPLALEGLEPPAMSRWAVVWNKAYPLRPAGLVATLFGTAEVVNTRRYRSVQGFDAQAMGFPFVAYRVRELTFESRYGIAPPVIALPDVRLNTRYVDVPGIDGTVRGQSKLGLPIVVSHFNRITPRWTHQERAGSPIVRNLTPEVRPRNWLDAEFGDGAVRLQWRPVKPDGTNMERFGLSRIADRRQKVEVPGFNTMRFGDKMTVRRTGMDPVVTQFIDLRRMLNTGGGTQEEAREGYGIEPASGQVSKPDFLKGYVFHHSGGTRGDMLSFGVSEITANSIRVEPGYWDLLVGEPMVSLKIRTLHANGIGPLVKDAINYRELGSWGLARLSPHTIYAVMEATEQARRNHPTPASPLAPANTGVTVGAHSISTYLGKLQHYAAYLGGFGRDYMGTPSVHNLIQRIDVKSWESLRMGLCTIPGPQLVEHDEPVKEGAFGLPALAYPPYLGPKTIRPSGWDAGVPVQTFVSHFHRAIYAHGLLSEALGSSKNSSTLNMPDTLHVGRPNLHQQVGFDASSLGVSWISHRVRELRSEGWESFLCEYDYQNFDKRMRVRRTGQSSAQWQVVGPRGFVATEHSAPDVKPGVHYIRPDGNSDQFRKGVPA